MDIRKILIAAASTLSISLSANSANAEWKVMGKSNGGSEIDLSMDEIFVTKEHGLSHTAFNYRIKTKGKSVTQIGLVNCRGNNPSAWVVPSGIVAADSPASKAMLSKVCGIAKHVNADEAVVPPTGGRITVLHRSMATPLSIYGTHNCTVSASLSNNSTEDINCNVVRITGLQDKKTYLYYHFVNEFGNGYVFVTERFNPQSPGSAKILAVGKEVDGDLSLTSVAINPVNTCDVKAQSEGRTKVSCYYSSDEGTIIGNINGY
jgi:hypothetical protein